MASSPDRQMWSDAQNPKLENNASRPWVPALAASGNLAQRALAGDNPDIATRGHASVHRRETGRGRRGFPPGSHQRYVMC